MSQKEDRVIELLEKIENHLNPPFWKKLLRWFFANFFTILFLSIAGYFLWQIRMELQNLSGFMAKTASQIESVKPSVLEPLERFKFWE